MTGHSAAIGLCWFGTVAWLNAGQPRRYPAPLVPMVTPKLQQYFEQIATIYGGTCEDLTVHLVYKSKQITIVTREIPPGELLPSYVCIKCPSESDCSFMVTHRTWFDTFWEDWVGRILRFKSFKFGDRKFDRQFRIMHAKTETSSPILSDLSIRRPIKEILDNGFEWVGCEGGIVRALLFSLEAEKIPAPENLTLVFDPIVNLSNLCSKTEIAG